MMRLSSTRIRPAFLAVTAGAACPSSFCMANFCKIKASSKIDIGNMPNGALPVLISSSKFSILVILLCSNFFQLSIADGLRISRLWRQLSLRGLLTSLTLRVVNRTELGFFHSAAVRWYSVQCARFSGRFLRRSRAHRAQVVGGLQSAQPRQLVGLVQLAPGHAGHVYVQRLGLV